MKRRLSCGIALVACLVFNRGALQAAGFAQPFPENHFQEGFFETSLGAGILFSPFAIGLERPVVNYSVTEIQFGYMATKTHGSNILRGNFETAASFFGDGIFDGRGNYVTGATAWFRYNFVPRNCRLVPFVQIGIGLTETDLDRRIEGGNFNFNENFGIGARYFIASNWSLNLEYRFQHISNAGLSTPNRGVNADGPILSLSYFF